MNILPPYDFYVKPQSPKSAQMELVDLIGPYKIPNKKYKGSNSTKKQFSTIWCVTMIDPATSWFEIKHTNTKQEAITVANIVE